MGGSNSISKFEVNPQLELLVSSKRLENVDEVFWDKLFDFSFLFDEKLLNDAHFYEVVKNYIQKFGEFLAGPNEIHLIFLVLEGKNNLATQNFARLVAHCAQQLKGFPRDPKVIVANKEKYSKVLHEVFLVRIFAKYFVEFNGGGQLRRQFEIILDGHNVQVLSDLIEAMIKFCIECEVK